MSLQSVSIRTIQHPLSPFELDVRDLYLFILSTQSGKESTTVDRYLTCNASERKGALTNWGTFFCLSS